MPRRAPDRRMMQWEPHSEDGLRELAEMGLHPRAAGFGKIRVVGVYEVPYCDHVEVTEVVVRKPYWMVNLADWGSYEPLGWDPEWGTGLADFYPDEEGRELIGSYLQAPPIRPTTRLVIVTYDGMHSVPFPRSRMPHPTPIPERLLRLIWLEL